MRRNLFDLFFTLMIFIIEIDYSRPAPANSNICNRFPSASFCRNQLRDQGTELRDSSPEYTADQNQNRPEPVQIGVDQTRTLTRQEQVRVRSDQNIATYCSTWTKHYAVHCDGQSANQEKSGEFCQYYKSSCHSAAINAITPPPLPEDPVPKPSSKPIKKGKGKSGTQTTTLPPAQPLPDLASLFSQSQPLPPPSAPANNGNVHPNLVSQPLAVLGAGNAVTQGPPSAAAFHIGQNSGVGNMLTGVGADINPLSGVMSDSSMNIAGMPITSKSGVNFGGLIPFGLGNIMGNVAG